MCQTCINRGYNDYPKFIGSAEHLDDYQKGFNQRQSEVGGTAECVNETDYCDKCFQRGKDDYYANCYTPPTTKRGHKESYDEGYHFIEKQDEKKKQQIEEQERQERLEQELYYEKQKRINKNTYRAPSQGSSGNDFLAKAIAFVAIIAGLIWLAVQFAIPLILINLSIITLLTGLFFKKAWRTILFSISMLGSVFVLFDYNKGWFTKSLVENANFFHDFIPVFFFLNIATGLVALYFIIDKYYLKTTENENHKLFQDKKQNIAFASIIILGVGIFTLQKFVLDKSNLQSENNIASTNVVSSTQSSTENSNQQISENNSINDENYKTKIKNFVQAEDNRDFNTLYSYMSSNFERYWDMEYPSQEDLNNRYTKIWAKLISSSNQINEIIKIDNSTFDLHNTFTFTGKKTGETKNVNSVVRYKFDEQGKIIYINEVK